MISEPLSQYEEILKNAIRTSMKESGAKLAKTFQTLLIEILTLYMILPRKINFTQMDRYGKHGEQFTGLMDCQARHKSQLDFAFNASFASLNAAKVFMKDNGMDNSMAKVKSLMFNANYTKLIFDMSRCRPNRTLISKIVKELIGWQPKAA